VVLCGVAAVQRSASAVSVAPQALGSNGPEGDEYGEDEQLLDH
jgi:hypothetical protein